MALSINQRATVALTSVGSTTLSFTAKLQLAATSTLYPEGTVFDCSNYKTETITGTITVRRAGITFLFGEGDFTMSALGDMFDIQAPNVTIIGVSRSAKDSVSANGSTRFIMTNTSGGFHITSTPSSVVSWKSSDSLTVMNVDLVGVKSAYTASGSTAVYSLRGAGGIMINEGNPDASGSNLNNVWINEVLIEGTRQHGIMIYGGMASKIQNTRVRNAGGHGFYIAGSTTSTSLDTCYASGCYLAGFALHNTSYSTLNNCASDSNGLGYWMRNANAVTMSSCGAEACEVRSSIPANLGITLPSQAGTITINDIGSDSVNYIKGSSFLFIGGSNITGTSCYSKDPGNRSGQTTFASKFTAHIYAENGTEKVNMDNFLTAGTSPTKYMYRLGDVYNFTIDAFIDTYDPSNPGESPDGAMTPIAEVLDAGGGNVFGDLSNAWSFAERRNTVVDPTANFRINQLYVENRISIPTYNAHPAEPQAGTIYFNTALNKLYIFSGSGWFDTCCATAPTPAPECVFPNGSATLLTEQDFRASYFYIVGTKTYFLSSAVGNNLTDNPEAPILMVFDSSTEVLTPLVTRNDVFGLQSLIQFIPSTLGYSSLTNSFYIGFLWNYGNTEGFTLSDSYNKLIKYNLNTATIDATVEEYIGFDPAEASADKVFGTGQVRYVAQGSTLKQINLGYYSDNIDALKPVVIVNRNINTLEIISQVTGDDIKANSEGQSGPFINNNMINDQILIADNRILTNVILNEGDTDLKFGVLDITNGLMSYVTYDTLASPYPSFVNYVRMTFSKSQTDSSVFFLTDSISGKIYEIDLNTFNIENEWSLGLPTYGVYDYVVNSVRFLIFTSASYNTQNSLYEWKLTTFNTVSNELTYSPYIIAYTQDVNQLYYSATLRNGMVFEILNDSMYAASSQKIQKFCAPYAV